MQVVNRSVIIIKPREPYLSWANNAGQSMESLGEFRRQSTAILIPESAYKDQAHRFLKQNFLRIFEIELEGWTPDKRRWPPVRDYETFIAWFDVEVLALVLDGDDELLKEPYE